MSESLVLFAIVLTVLLAAFLVDLIAKKRFVCAGLYVLTVLIAGGFVGSFLEYY